MTYFITAKTVNILLGDFNIATFDEIAYARLNNVVRNYNLTVREASHLNRGLLDHIYLQKSFPVTVITVVKNIYFSDHYAVKTYLPIKNNAQDKDIHFNTILY